MPSTMVHFKTAHDLLQETGNNTIDLPQFYMGTHAPDSVHMREGYIRADKDKSHLRNGYLKMDLGNIQEFISSIDKSGSSYSFLMGYAVHLLTDYVWVESNGPFSQFESEFISDPNPPLTPQPAAYYNDTDCIELELYNTLPWRDEAFNLLKKAKPEGISELVTTEETDAWRNRCLTWFSNFDSTKLFPIRYITPQMMENFYIDSLKFCKTQLFT